MKALVLAAGRGARMNELTENLPKPLISLNGKPLLGYLLDALNECGVSDVTLVSGYLSDRIESFVNGSCRIIRNPVYDRTNSIYSLWLAKACFSGKPFLLLNGDLVMDTDCIRKLIDHRAQTALLVDDQKPLKDGEMNVVISGDRIVRIGKEIGAENAQAESAQVVKFGAGDSARLFDRVTELIKRGRKNGFPTMAYDVIFAQSRMVPVYTADCRWFEIDTLEDLAAAEKVFV